MIRIFLAILAALVLALGWSLWRAEVHKGNAEAAKVEAEAAKADAAEVRVQLAIERGVVEALDAIAARDLEAEREITTRMDSLAAAVMRGDVRVRHEIGALYTAQLSGTAAITGELAGAAERGAGIVTSAVGVGAKCDSRQQALVDAYEAARQAAAREDRE